MKRSSRARISFLAFLAAIPLLVQRAESAPPAAPPPEVRITLLGTGNPRPSSDRSGPASLVETMRGTPRRILVDTGRGVTTRLWELGGPELLSGIDIVLLTHLHSDHVVGLPDLWLTGWVFGRSRPLRLVGPRGTRELAEGLKRAFEFDIRMRRDVDERFPPAGIELPVTEVEPGVVLDEDGLRITAFAVDHGLVAPALGYRIDSGGRSVVFSGDTRPSDALIAAARGVDVLVHEVLSPEVERKRARVADPARIERIIARHTTPEQAGRIFAETRPRLAVYTHVVPSPATAADLEAPTRRVYLGPLVAGTDLLEIEVGERITTRKRTPRPER